MSDIIITAENLSKRYWLRAKLSTLLLAGRSFMVARSKSNVSENLSLLATKGEACLHPAATPRPAAEAPRSTSCPLIGAVEHLGKITSPNSGKLLRHCDTPQNLRKSPHGNDLTSQSNGISERPSYPSCPAICRTVHPTASTATRGGRNLHRPTPLPRRGHPIRRVRSTEPARPQRARKL
jgi:hypothetical protein